MVINKTDWATTYQEEAFPNTANATDENIANMLDKRSGYTDTLQSQNTVIPGAGFIANKSSIMDIDPSSVSIPNGTLSIGAKIVGDKNSVISSSITGDPLRFGFQEVDITSASLSSFTYLLANNQYNTFAIRFVGNPGGNTTIFFPSIASYTKVLDNQTSYTLTIETTSQPSTTIPPVILLPSSQATIYAGGSMNIRKGSDVPVIQVVSEQSISYFPKLPTFLGNILFTSSFTNTILDGSNSSTHGFGFGGLGTISKHGISNNVLNFPNVLSGDQFIITMNANINQVASVNLYVGYGSNPVPTLFGWSNSFPLPEGNLVFQAPPSTYPEGASAQVVDGIQTIYTATVSEPHGFGISIALNSQMITSLPFGAQASIATPTNISVIQTRS